MPGEIWRWDPKKHPAVAGLFEGPAGDLDWCDGLETAPGDAVVGKVLCVCAAAAIAREVIATLDGDASQADAALEMLRRWIDDPTDERFERIRSLLFDEGSPEFDTYGVVWWALRVATSTVGFAEAGWALRTTCAGALKAGFDPERLRSIAERELAAWGCAPGEDRSA